MQLVDQIKSDEQVYQAALEEWLAVLAQLWIAYDKPIEHDRLEIYRKQFCVLPLGLLEQAVDRAIRNHKFNSVPTPGEVWEATHYVLGNPSDIDVAIQRWVNSIPDGIYRLGGETT